MNQLKMFIGLKYCVFRIHSRIEYLSESLFVRAKRHIENNDILSLKELWSDIQNTENVDWPNVFRLMNIQNGHLQPPNYNICV